jgi:hypothetical protein
MCVCVWARVCVYFCVCGVGCGWWVACKRVYVRVHRYLCVISLRESVVCVCVFVFVLVGAWKWVCGSG